MVFGLRFKHDPATRRGSSNETTNSNSTTPISEEPGPGPVGFGSLPRPHARLSERASGAASRRPARAIASGGEGGGARPRAADEQLVGGGQGVCVLPSRTEGVRGMRGDARAASRGCTGRDRGASRVQECGRAQTVGHLVGLLRIADVDRYTTVNRVTVTPIVTDSYIDSNSYCLKLKTQRTIN